MCTNTLPFRVCIWFVDMCVCTQGERGESGLAIAAQGSIASGLAGPKGLKVIFIFTAVFFETFGIQIIFLILDLSYEQIHP